MGQCDLAIEKKNLNILELLFKHNANANLKHMYGGTPLHYAVRNGDIQIVKELLDNGANSDAQDSYQTTPLIIALESKRIDIAETLLAYGANINYPCNSIGQTVLHDMICNGTIEIIKHGMLVNIKMEIIQFLLENGANVDLASYNKETPLLASLMIDRLDIAECLLKKGANANSPCFDSGQTALHYMITHCRLEQNLTKKLKMPFRLGACLKTGLLFLFDLLPSEKPNIVLEIRHRKNFIIHNFFTMSVVSSGFNNQSLVQGMTRSCTRCDRIGYKV